MEGLVPGVAALHAEMLVEQGTVEALDGAVELGPPDLVGSVLDVLKLKEDLVGVLVGSATLFRAGVNTAGAGQPSGSGPFCG